MKPRETYRQKRKGSCKKPTYTCRGKSLVHPETPRVEQVGVTAKAGSVWYSKPATPQCTFHVITRPIRLVCKKPLFSLSERIPARPFGLKLVLQESPLRVEVAPHALDIMLLPQEVKVIAFFFCRCRARLKLRRSSIYLVLIGDSPVREKR